LIILQLQGVPNIFAGSGGGGLGNIMGDIGILLIYVLFAGVVLFFLYRFIIKPMFYPIKVIVASRRGEKGNFFYEDKGRFIRKKSGFEDFKLFKRSKAHVRAPSLEHLYPAEKGRAYLFLREVEKNNFFPLMAADNVNDPSLFEAGVTTLEQKQWVMLEINKLMQSLQPKLNILEKYGHYIVFLVTMVIVVVILWIVMGKVSETNALLSATQDKVAETAKEIYGGLVGAKP